MPSAPRASLWSRLSPAPYFITVFDYIREFANLSCVLNRWQVFIVLRSFDCFLVYFIFVLFLLGKARIRRSRHSCVSVGFCFCNALSFWLCRTFASIFIRIEFGQPKPSHLFRRRDSISQQGSILFLLIHPFILILVLPRSSSSLHDVLTHHRIALTSIHDSIFVLVSWKRTVPLISGVYTRN